MSTVVIAIETGNAAFEDNPGPEIVRILRRLAERIENLDMPEAGEFFRLFDRNGGVVGEMAFTSRSATDITKGL